MVAVRFTRGETNFPRVDLDASRSGSLPATLVLATSEPVRCNGCQCTGYPCRVESRHRNGRGIPFPP